MPLSPPKNHLCHLHLQTHSIHIQTHSTHTISQSFQIDFGVLTICNGMMSLWVFIQTVPSTWNTFSFLSILSPGSHEACVSFTVEF